MRALVTGGAGFIGRWVVKKLLDKGDAVVVLDDLSNGSSSNITEFQNKSVFKFIRGDIKDIITLENIFSEHLDIVYHLAAEINVQKSIDLPGYTFENDVIGTFNVLEMCRKYRVKMLFMSTCMVYDRCSDNEGINEIHPTKPASPYAACKLSGEALTLSYYHAYGLPTVVVRPFNTYGPYQKTTGEGGVVAIFSKRMLEGKSLQIYGDGTQTRDLMYVEDCADFVIKGGESKEVNGDIINAGTGRAVSINELANMISRGKVGIEHVPHIHPQSEIARLLCDNSKAKRMLNWQPRVSLEEGIKRTIDWIKGAEE